MQTVNMLEAKSTLSRLVESIEQGAVREIVIARMVAPQPSWLHWMHRAASALAWRAGCLWCLILLTRTMPMSQRTFLAGLSRIRVQSLEFAARYSRCPLGDH